MTTMTSTMEMQAQQRLLPRRAHKKSSDGCVSCKQRKIKCDEAHPVCGNCARHYINIERCEFGISGHSRLRSMSGKRPRKLRVVNSKGGLELHFLPDASLQFLSKDGGKLVSTKLGFEKEQSSWEKVEREHFPLELSLGAGLDPFAILPESSLPGTALLLKHCKCI